jgi:cell division transport system permease protein
MARRPDRRRRAAAPRGGPGKGAQRIRRSSTGAPGWRPSRLLAWLEEHPRAALGSLGRLWRNPVASGLTVAVIAVALALPGALWMLLENAQRATGGWDRGARISVYMEPGIGAGEVERAAEAVARQDGIRVIERISADEALADFRSLAGFDEALAALERNPLPAVVVIEPEDVGNRSAASLAELTGELGAIEGVDRVQLDLEWVERLYALLDLVERGVAVIAALLGAGVLLIVGNTIRLDILNRREEIEVTKLIGASDAFIRRPFLYGGLWYGLCGGLAAWALLAVARGLLAGPAARLAAAYGSSFRLEGLAAGESGLLVLAGAGLGLLGSWLAVGRHLRAIEPG